MAINKDIAIRMSWGEFSIQLVAEGSSWNPDVANDLVKRATESFKDGINTLMEQGLLDVEDVDDE